MLVHSKPSAIRLADEHEGLAVSRGLLRPVTYTPVSTECCHDRRVVP